jgi:membrane-bound metal-dependent hydrolase YbcI (DUF457 family)
MRCRGECGAWGDRLPHVPPKNNGVCRPADGSAPQAEGTAVRTRCVLPGGRGAWDSRRHSEGIRLVPGFREHITGSTIVGIGYGAAAWCVGDIPPVTCGLAAGLCAVAGMLPDLDSGPGVPLRESVAFAAAVVPVMVFPRLEQIGIPMEGTILICTVLYLAIRFGLSWLLKKYSVHRGMFHSLPAAAIAGLAAFLVFGAEQPLHRYFVASAVVLGFITHLVLDEIWSVRLGLFGPKVKKSFGTAMKFLGTETSANLITYLLLAMLAALAANDAAVTEKTAAVRQQMEQASRQAPAYPVAVPVYRR